MRRRIKAAEVERPARSVSFYRHNLNTVFAGLPGLIVVDCFL